MANATWFGGAACANFSKALSAMALLGLASPLTAAPVYKIEAIAQTETFTPRTANDINNDGVVVGSGLLEKSNGRKSTVPYRYRAGAVAKLDAAGSTNASAAAVNLRGEAAGDAGNGQFWDRKGKAHDLGDPPHCPGTVSAKDLNDLHQVAGQVSCLAPFRHVASVSVDGVTTELGVLEGHTASGASSINNQGQVTGYSTQELPDSSTVTHAFLWAGGVMVDLGTLGGINSDGAAVNELGQVVGTSDDAEGRFRPFFYDGAVMTALPDCDDSMLLPHNLNNLGQVVGAAFGKIRLGDAVLIGDGECHRLEELLDASGEGWALFSAQAINDAGQIVGNGKLQGEQRAFIATPVGR